MAAEGWAEYFAETAGSGECPSQSRKQVHVPTLLRVAAANDACAQTHSLRKCSGAFAQLRSALSRQSAAGSHRGHAPPVSAVWRSRGARAARQVQRQRAVAAALAGGRPGRLLGEQSRRRRRWAGRRRAQGEQQVCDAADHASRCLWRTAAASQASSATRCRRGGAGARGRARAAAAEP